ncbi:MAG: SPOR domain-containing protein [Gemmatimonadales bacterium]
MSRAFLCGAILAIFPIVGSAQAPVGVNPVYRRAQMMVNDGNAVAGRALVDSMISIAAPGSNDYAEGVYWRAILAATAAEAEMDYRRLVVDYSLSPRVDDALIRLAQLELARANYDGALRHLNRLAAEHPDSPARGRATYWTARALFDKNDVQGGCTALIQALAITSESDAELRNQINYLNQRCAGIVIGAPSTPPAVDATTSAMSSPVAAPANPSPVDSSVIAVKPVAPPAPVVVDSVKTAIVATPPSRPVADPVVQAPAPKTRPQPPSKPRDTGPTMVETPRTAPPVPSSASGGKTYSVQIAAYNAKSQADAMVAKLKKSGYEARVDGTSAPFRVRIGKYATNAQATAVQRSLKAKQIEGIVVQADIK